MAGTVLALVAVAFFVGPWSIRSAKLAAILCLICVVAIVGAMVIPAGWISAAEDCPANWPPTGYVSCGDNAFFIFIPASLIFVGALTKILFIGLRDSFFYIVSIAQQRDR